MKNSLKSVTGANRPATFRLSLLASACVLAAGGLGAAGALAQSNTTYLLNLTIPPVLLMTDYADWIESDQYNSGTGSVGSATVNAVTQGTTLAGGGVTPVTVTGNAIQAFGGGNKNTSSVSLSLIRAITTPTAADGIGLLASQVQGNLTTPVPVQSSVTASVIHIVETGLPPAKLVLSNNTLSAATQLNSSDSSVEGALPAAGYTSAQTGSITAGVTAAGVISSDSTGSVNIATHQTALNASALAGSFATVSDGDVTLDVQRTTGGVLSQSLAVTGNTVAADFGANRSTNIFNALAGASSFTGSVAVTNAQANIETLGGATTGTAIVEDASITANVRNRPASGNAATALTAPLVVSGNTIAATSAGNTAGERTASGSILAGNAIVFGSGNDVTGTGSGSSSSTGVGTLSLTASLSADLALLNAQGNQGTALVSRVQGAGGVGGNVTVSADDTNAGGSITASQNTVSAAAQGNLAGNLIATDATNFAATAAAANLQTNVATAVEAHNLDAAVTVGVGKINVTVTGPITASENTLSARAEGSVAATTVALDAVNLTANPSGARTVTADLVGTGGWGETTAEAGVSATNLQGNYQPAGGIWAELTGNVAVNVSRNGAATGVRVPVDAAAITLESNVLSAQATGNQASTGVALAGTNGSVQAAVGNTQFHDGDTRSTVTDSGVRAYTGAVTNSAVTVNQNTVSSAATANDGTNALSTDFSRLTAGPGGFTAAANAQSDGTSATSNAAFGIASAQYNRAALTAQNSTSGVFSVVDVGGAGTGVTVNNSDLTANDNRATAAVTGNRVANTLTVDAATLATADGAATQLAGIANLQVNEQAGASLASVERSTTAITVVQGVRFNGSVLDSNLTASGNAVAATALGNTAANTLTARTDNLQAAAPTGTTYTGSIATGPSAIQNEFALLNQQTDSTAGRTASTNYIQVGVEDNATDGKTVVNSNLSVQRNQIVAEARNNNAANAVNLSGFASLDSGAGLLNQQTSSTDVSALMVNSRIRIRAADDTTLTNTRLAVTDNTVRTLAVGSSASNGMTLGATNLSGNANIEAVTGGSTVTGASLGVNADYGVGNVQQQSGTVTADVDASIRIFLGPNSGTDVGSDVIGGSASLTGNATEAVAQATSANNSLAMAATNVSGVTGAVASTQVTNGAVTANQTAPSGLSASIDGATSFTNTPVVVADNRIFVSAGQNEATNGLTVTATNIAGGGRGNNQSAYTAGTATSGADFSVLNVQAGEGNVTATALPQLVGVQTDAVTGGNVTVSDNDVTAKAHVNNAANGLALNAGATLAATAAVNNVQNTGEYDVTATVGGLVNATMTNVGLSRNATPLVLNGTAVTVAGNALTAQAGGNTSANGLEATAGATIAGSSPNPTFAVLNTQGNAATVYATVTYASIGLSLPGGSMASSTASVLANQVLASGYGNTASNSIGLSALPGSANQASAGISNAQNNSAGVSAFASTISTGVSGGSASGGSIVVSGNSTVAQSGGNSSGNRILGR